MPAAVVFAIVWFTPGSGPLRVLLDGLTLKVPLLGRAARQLALSRFSRTFRMLYECGSIPMADCVEKSVEMAGNSIIRRQLSGGIESARAGNPVSEGFSPDLPPEFVETWRVGEESGALDETARRIADAAAADSEHLFEQLALWLPRLVYALVSIFIIINIFRGISHIAQGYRDVLQGP